MMHDEIVKRRKWLSDQEFLDLVGATNLIPGPNSTEMAIHIGFLRAGWPGLITGGVCFIAPAMLIVLSLAWVYARFGAAPEAGWLLYGIKPVVIAIIVQALWNMGQNAVKGLLTGAIGMIVVTLYFVGINEIVLLFAGGMAAMLVLNYRRLKKGAAGMLVIPVTGAFALAGVSMPFNLPWLFFVFLKIFTDSSLPNSFLIHSATPASRAFLFSAVDVAGSDCRSSAYKSLANASCSPCSFIFRPVR
jgi:chromate transporter